VLLFNVRGLDVAGRLERALTDEGYRVAIESSATAVAGDEAAGTYDAVLVTSQQPVQTAVADARRRCPRANAVSTLVVDGVIIAQPFEVAPQSARPHLARIRALAATVRAAMHAA
jgi:hypothetical protein